MRGRDYGIFLIWLTVWLSELSEFAEAQDMVEEPPQLQEGVEPSSLSFANGPEDVMDTFEALSPIQDTIHFYYIPTNV